MQQYKIHITHEELQRLAQACRLILPTDAQERVVTKLEAVLSYAAQLATLCAPVQQEADLLGPVLRADRPREESPAALMMRGAPLQIEHYFVVPVIIKEST